MKRLLVLLYIALSCTLLSRAQTLGGYTVVDHLVTAVHPNGCPAFYVTGPPDQLTWVNFDAGQVVSGTFGMPWTIASGNQLLLETSYHADNYIVRLKFSNGQFSAPHTVLESQWTQIPDVSWTHLFTDCSVGSMFHLRFVRALDFALHFGVTSSQTITGIEITFLGTTGAPDLAGVYIVNSTAAPCPPINLGNDLALCTGQIAQLNATTAGATYLWQNGATTPSLLVTQPGTYWVQVTRPCGVRSDTINVTYTSPPTVELGNNATICPGQSLTLNATYPGATYLWQNGATSPTLNVTQPGTYSVTVTNSCGVATDAVTIAQGVAPVVSLGPDTTLCTGQTLTLDVSAPGTTYLWQNGATSPALTVSAAGTYWVRATNGCGTTTDTLTVAYLAAPSVNLGNDIWLCAGQTATLTANSPGATLLWSDLSTGTTLTATQPGTYWVEATNACGTVTDTLQVFEQFAPIIELGDDLQLCPGQLATKAFEVVGASFLWQNGSTDSMMVFAQPGIYWLEVSNACGSMRDSMELTFKPVPQVDLGAGASFCLGESFTLDATTPNATYLWHNSSTNPTVAVTEAGTYWVTVTADGCSTTDSITVATTECEVVLQMPNIFTPNGDGLNDLFLPKELSGISQAKLTLFNRWGNKLFETGNMATGWNGTHDGSLCTDGIYFWSLAYTTFTGKTEVLKGSVTLLR